MIDERSARRRADQQGQDGDAVDGLDTQAAGQVAERTIGRTETVRITMYPRRAAELYRALIYLEVLLGVNPDRASCPTSGGVRGLHKFATAHSTALCGVLLLDGPAAVGDDLDDAGTGDKPLAARV